MNRAILWLWDRGVVSAFLAGFFAILPIVLTLAVIHWVVDKLMQAVGPGSALGNLLHRVGFKFVANDRLATLMGWAIVILGIWSLGILVKSTARYRLIDVFHNVLKRIPVVKSIYGPVSQVVSMFQQKDQSEMSGMPVVFCTFGEQQGGGFLGLLSSKEAFRFGDEDCNVIYIPTSPVPMSGCVIFVPTRAVRLVDMEVEQLMQIYFSLGVMASNVIPANYVPSRS